ncbi:MAG: NAD-dependent epimerase/dehydratase family protein [Bacteroidales bacterium]|nr:NAD-dependent epimerase/dehydratase family protein [Bacteroidales bacterium]
MKKKLYIITGANGHLASTIIRYLAQDDCLVRGLLLPTEQHEDSEKISYFKGDITDVASLERIFSDTDRYEVTVIHAAGLITIDDEMTPKLYNVNVNGTRNIIAMCQTRPVHRLLYVSSVHAIDEGDGTSVIQEVSSFPKEKVYGAYAITKAEASQAVLDAVGKGLDAVIVHPSAILGPFDDGRNHLIQFIKQYLDGTLLGGVCGGYDFVDVRDVAKACITAADEGRCGEAYILSNEYLPIPELMEYLSEMTGKRRKPCFSLPFAKAFARLSEWFGRVTHTRPLLTRYALQTVGTRSRFSHEKATRELAYRPRDIRDTIRDTIRYLQYGYSESLLT